MKPKLPDRWYTKLEDANDAEKLAKAGKKVIRFDGFTSRGLDFWSYPLHVSFEKYEWRSFYTDGVNLSLEKIISMLTIEDFVNPKQKEE